MVQKEFKEFYIEKTQTEYVHVGGEPFWGHNVCYKCFENQNKNCVLPEDGSNAYLEEMVKAEASILASPLYFGDITPKEKHLLRYQ